MSKKMTLQYYYRIIIDPLNAEDGGGFLASVPELPDCMSDGDTPNEALASLQDAIEQWIIEAKALGRVIPEPKMAAA
jgi:antitoxin HicB